LEEYIFKEILRIIITSIELGEATVEIVISKSLGVSK
jgi:hypothetical protein